MPDNDLTLATKLALDIVAPIDAAATVGEAATALLQGLRPLGALSVVAHASGKGRSPADLFDVPPAAVIVPDGWTGSTAAAFVNENNPNPDAALKLRRPFRWREVSLPTRALTGAYWEALSEFGAIDGLGSAFRLPGETAGVSLAFASNDWSPQERRAMDFACFAFIEKARELSPAPPEPPHLSARERDCLAYVAEGKTDWEISVILGISQNTAHQYVESARKKLNAVSRAQAAARFVLIGYF